MTIFSGKQKLVRIVALGVAMWLGFMLFLRVVLITQLLSGRQGLYMMILWSIALATFFYTYEKRLSNHHT